MSDEKPGPEECFDEPDAGSRDVADAASENADEGGFEQVVRERDQYLTMAQRAHAELENYRKRVARERESERKYAPQLLATELLPALDNLDLALESAEGQSADAGIIDGVRLVRKQLLDSLAKHGVTQVDPLGSPFDPNVHEAVSQFASPDHEPMTVLQVLRKGYCLHDRVLRPANVIVASRPEKEEA